MPDDIDRLTRRLLDDRARQIAKPPPRVAGCFLCGRSYSLQAPTGDNSTRFCSDKCREAYDAGAMPVAELNPYAVDQGRIIAGPPPGRMPKAMRMGRHGFYIACLHCKREFESKGLRCCSTECERGLKDRAETLAVIAEVGGSLTEKRKCSVCGEPVPKYVGTGKHRRLTNKTKTTCSNRCREKARKMGLSEGSNCGLEGSGPPEAIPPVFGPSTPPLNVLGGHCWPDAPDIDLKPARKLPPDVIPDVQYPGMYRVGLPDGQLSDMVNLTRAIEASRQCGRS